MTFCSLLLRFDDGDERLFNFTDLLVDVPVTSYNVIPGPNSPLLNYTRLQKYLVKAFDGGEKVGLCGITPKTKVEGSSFPDPGTTIQDEVEATTACVQALQSEGVNKIVVLSHVGFEMDQSKLAQVEGVDVIIGGDSHTLMGVNASDIGGPSSPYSYATIVNNVCIVQAWEYQKVVGELTVTWDADGNVLDCSGTPYLPYNPNKFTILPSDGNGEEYDLSNQDDIDKMNTFLSSKSNFRPADEDQNVVDVLEPFYELTEIEMNVEIAEALEYICHTRGQGDTSEKCPDRPIQSKLGGGVCLIVSQGKRYFLIQQVFDNRLHFYVLVN